MVRSFFLTILVLLSFGGAWFSYVEDVVVSKADFNVNPNFKIYDGTLYKNKPDLTLYGMNPVNIIYASRFWKDWAEKPNLETLPDKNTIKQLAMEAKQKNQLTVLDIEHWELNPDNKIKFSRNLSKYIKVISIFRQNSGSVNLGYYSKIPMPAFTWSLKDKASDGFRQWEDINNNLTPISRAVDVIFPSLYTYSTDMEKWVQYAIENIKQARKYGNPVVVFIWPQYSERKKTLANRFISTDFWLLQLKTVSRYADGVVIWGGWGGDGPMQWDNNAQWWKITKDYINKMKL